MEQLAGLHRPSGQNESASPPERDITSRNLGESGIVGSVAVKSSATALARVTIVEMATATGHFAKEIVQ